MLSRLPAASSSPTPPLTNPPPSLIQDELRKLICVSWAAYLDENPRVITDHETKWYLDCENCPFSGNLALGESLSTGFMGCSERLKLVRFMSSDAIAAANRGTDAQAFIAASEDNSALYIAFRGTSR